jgi:hypothetical protein
VFTILHILNGVLFLFAGAVMALQMKGHSILLVKDLADVVKRWKDEKSGSIRAQEFGRFETFSKTWQTSLFPLATDYPTTSVFGTALVYDVQRRTPSSLTAVDMGWEGIKPTPTKDHFIQEWLPGTQGDKDHFIRVDVKGGTEKHTSCVIFSFRFKAFPIEAVMPDKLEDLSLLWADAGEQSPDCVCCGTHVHLHEGEDLDNILCYECGRSCHVGTCGTINKNGLLCKLHVCEWLFTAVELEKNKAAKEVEALQHQNLHASLRAVAGASPTKVVW